MATVAIAGLIVGIVGVAVSAYATVESAQQAQEAANANRKRLRQEAQMQQQAADVSQAQFRERLRRTQGTAAAAIGASGVEAEGSPLLSMVDNARQGELQARLIDYGGKNRSYQAFADANAAAFEGRQRAQASYYSGAATTLTGASTLIRNYRPQGAGSDIGPT